jgi:hypothetical protein
VELHTIGSNQPINLRESSYVSVPIEYEVLTITPHIQFVSIIIILLGLKLEV